MGTVTVDPGQLPRDDRVDRCARDLGDARRREVRERVQQVGAYVGVDRVAGERVGDAPVREVLPGERLDGRQREPAQRIGERVAVLDQPVHRAYSASMRSTGQAPSCTSTR